MSSMYLMHINFSSIIQYQDVWKRFDLVTTPPPLGLRF